MKTLRTILLLAAVLLCLGACGRGSTMCWLTATNRFRPGSPPN